MASSETLKVNRTLKSQLPTGQGLVRILEIALILWGIFSIGGDSSRIEIEAGAKLGTGPCDALDRFTARAYSTSKAGE